MEDISGVKIPPVPIQNVNFASLPTSTQAAMLRQDGQVVIAAIGTNHAGLVLRRDGKLVTTYRNSFLAKQNATGLRFVFSNYGNVESFLGTNTGENLAPPYWMQMAIHDVGPAGINDDTPKRTWVTHRGKRWIKRTPGDWLVTDRVKKVASTKGRIITLINVSFGRPVNINPGGTADFTVAAPTAVAGATSAGQVAGNYRTGHSYLFAYQARLGGSEDDGPPVGHLSATVTVTPGSGTTNKVTVTIPANPGGEAASSPGVDVYGSAEDQTTATSALFLVSRGICIPWGGTVDVFTIPTGSHTEAVSQATPFIQCSTFATTATGGGYANFADAIPIGQGFISANGPQPSPLFVLGTPTDNTVLPTHANVGESINSGSDDPTHFPSYGGYWVMAADDAGIVSANFGLGGESDQTFARGDNHQLRMLALEGFSWASFTYGRNGLAATDWPNAYMEIGVLRRAYDAAALGQVFWISTAFPIAVQAVPDGYTTMNQTDPTGSVSETKRRANNDFRINTNAVGAVNVGTPSDYGLVNGSNKEYAPPTSIDTRKPFKVYANIGAGVVEITGYQWNMLAGDFAGGVVLPTAPTTGLVTFDYTARPSIASATGADVEIIEVGQFCEVNSLGVQTRNGGFWKAQGTEAFSGNTTAASAPDSGTNTITMTTDINLPGGTNLMGAAFRVTLAGPTYVYGTIASNTTGANSQITIQGTTSTGLGTLKIYLDTLGRGDGTHPSYRLHRIIADSLVVRLLARILAKRG